MLKHIVILQELLDFDYGDSDEELDPSKEGMHGFVFHIYFFNDDQFAFDFSFRRYVDVSRAHRHRDIVREFGESHSQVQPPEPDLTSDKNSVRI